MANLLVAQMLFLDSKAKQDITMYVNSPGGSVTAGATRASSAGSRNLGRAAVAAALPRAQQCCLPGAGPALCARAERARPCAAGMAVFDTMRHIRPDVSTTCVGLAASMGAFLLAAGQKARPPLALQLPAAACWMCACAGGRLKVQGPVHLAASSQAGAPCLSVRLLGCLDSQPPCSGQAGLCACSRSGTACPTRAS